MKEELISVIVPVYNVSKYLRQCLDSIVGQTYKNLEIILINDGSTDDSLGICLEFEVNDNRVFVANQNNSGIAGARNKGIQISKGSFVAFVDGDDWLNKNYIQELFNKVTGQDLVCCSYNRASKNGFKTRVLGVDGYFKGNEIRRRIVGLVEEELKDPSQADSLVTVWGKLYKADIMKQNQIKFVNTKLIGTAEDALFNITYLQFAHSVYVIDKPLYFYRKYTNSFTSTYKPNLFNQWKVLFSKIFDEVQKKEEVFYEAYYNRICLSIIGLGLNELLNPKGHIVIATKLQVILKDPLYRRAFKNLNLKYFPLHWKLFFFFAKYHMGVPLYFMLVAIKRIIRK